jgi:hypothetical protein
MLETEFAQSTATAVDDWLATLTKERVR